MRLWVILQPSGIDISIESSATSSHYFVQACVSIGEVIVFRLIEAVTVFTPKTQMKDKETMVEPSTENSKSNINRS